MNNKGLKVLEKLPINEKLPVVNKTYDNSFLGDSPGGFTAFTSGYVGHGAGDEADDFIEFLIELADEQDKIGQRDAANFIDYLIKNASYDNIDYFKKLKLLMNNQYSEGGNDSLAEFGENLYSSYKSFLDETGNSHTASGKAYLHMKNSGLRKMADTLEQNPVYVADSIVKVVKIMMSMISPEKRSGAIANISEKIFREFNPQEIASKKSPGGAAIGQSLALIKNILNSRDQLFIKIVLDEVRKKIGI